MGCGLNVGLSACVQKAAMKRAVKALRNGKSRCLDNIPIKLMKAGGISIVEDIWKPMKLIWQTEQMPTEWKRNA
jgi:hypothetical protein